MEGPSEILNEKVVKFIKAGVAFCTLVENTDNISGKTYCAGLLALTSKLYYLAHFLPVVQPIHEEGNEKFVQESDWQRIKDSSQKIFKQHDEFLEVFDPKMQESETPIVCSISENIADIYQDIKDFLLVYQIGTQEVMNDALWECKQDFETIWGQKAANTLRALHNILYGNVSLDEDETTGETDNQFIDTQNWILSKRIEQLNDEE